MPYAITFDSFQDIQKEYPEISWGRIEDIRNKKINYITPLYRTKSNCAIPRLVCKCDCGKYFSVYKNSIMSGNTTSCGCYHKKITKEIGHNNGLDLTGQNFGKLTVLKRDKGHNTYHGRNIVWRCRCECGTEISVIGTHLTSGHTTSCGCIKSKGEYLVNQLLQKLKINYIPQYYFSDCIITNSQIDNLPKFDFAIFDKDNKLQYLIEIDGEQHFRPRQNGHFTEDKVKEIHYRDMIKNNYCFLYNIPLIRIPYSIIDKNILKEEDIILSSSNFLITKENVEQYYINNKYFLCNFGQYLQIQHNKKSYNNEEIKRRFYYD